MLTLCYYVMCGLNAVYSLFPIFFCVIGAILASGTLGRPGEAAQIRPLGWILLALGTCMFLLSIASALLNFWTARSLRDRRRRVLCMVMAIVNCVSFPWGTLIGICTIIVLERPAVKAMFAGSQPPPLPIAHS